MKNYVLLLSALLLAAGCEGSNDLIANFDVDSWCGDVPCGWEVEGRIERVSTWHSHDYAVSLVGDDVELSQANPDANNEVQCITFSMLAMVEEGTRAYVALDFLDDGENDWSDDIPPGDFQTFTFHVTPPSWFEGVRFIVGKQGGGRVVLAKLQALNEREHPELCTADAVELENRPAFAPCENDDQCAFGRCIGGKCIGCQSDDDCEDDEVCGYGPWSDSAQYSANVIPVCVPPAEREVGAICVGDAECVTGVCCEGVCSQCCDDAPCQDGQTCQLSIVETEQADYVKPHQCAPGEGLAESGVSCTDDSDCASNACAELRCTGLCNSAFNWLGAGHCAQAACDEPVCNDVLSCAIETLDVGHCD